MRPSRPTSGSASIPRHADQMVRGTVVLPNGTGKVVRVAVFAQGEKAQEALRAGADEVGAEDLVKKIEAGWLDFDVALAAPDTMGMVGRLGKILGRRGLMPNPKSGTITFDLERAIREVKSRPGRVQGRQVGHHPRRLRQDQLRGRRARRQPGRPHRRGQPGQAEPARRASTSAASPSPARWAPASGSTCRPSSRWPRRPDGAAPLTIRGDGHPPRRTRVA